jgi:hypothetical protein
MLMSDHLADVIVMRLSLGGFALFQKGLYVGELSAVVPPLEPLSAEPVVPVEVDPEPPPEVPESVLPELEDPILESPPELPEEPDDPMLEPPEPDDPLPEDDEPGVLLETDEEPDDPPPELPDEEPDDPPPDDDELLLDALEPPELPPPSSPAKTARGAKSICRMTRKMMTYLTLRLINCHLNFFFPSFKVIDKTVKAGGDDYAIYKLSFEVSFQNLILIVQTLYFRVRKKET